MKYLTGVYLITNSVNGKIYVGSASKNNIETRWKSHEYKLNKGKHTNKHLQYAWNKYGKSSFIFTVIERCVPNDCLKIEQWYLDELESYNHNYGYNICSKAGNTKGVRYSTEHRKKLSEIQKKVHARPEVIQKRKEIFNNPEYKLRHAESMKKVMNTKEYKEKMSISCKKAQADPKIKKKISDAIRLKYATDPSYREKVSKAGIGRKHSEETKEKMRLSNTPELREKKRLANLGRKISVETRLKMSKPKSLETRKSMTESAKKGWIKRRLNES